MKKLAILALSATGVVAIALTPALAQHAGMGGKQPTTRAEVQAKVSQHFTLFDTNKDGAVAKAEFDAHLAKREATRDARRAEHFAAMDTDKNGQISRAEFDAARENRREDRKEARADGKGHHKGMMRGHRGGMKMGAQWFERLDANKDGRVTLAEASAKPLEMFDKADANKDGTLSDTERKAAREARRAEWQAKKAS